MRGITWVQPKTVFPAVSPTVCWPQKGSKFYYDSGMLKLQIDFSYIVPACTKEHIIYFAFLFAPHIGWAVLALQGKHSL